MASYLRNFSILLALLLCIHEAILLPVDDSGKDKAPPKPKYQCEYKCASYVRKCEEDKSEKVDGKCTEECEKWTKVCDSEGRCHRQCASTIQKCDEKTHDMAVAAKPKCMAMCTGWDVICTVPDDMSPIISQTDDGSGGKNSFEPTKCLRTCSRWDSLYRCTKIVCNRLPQMPTKGDVGKDIMNVLADVECFGTCVTWSKFGTCVHWKCVPMESLEKFKISNMQRGWWGDFWDKVKEWTPTAIAICTATGLCG